MRKQQEREERRRRKKKNIDRSPNNTIPEDVVLTLDMTIDEREQEMWRFTQPEYDYSSSNSYAVTDQPSSLTREKQQCGENTQRECKFPFVYKGKVHNDCITSDSTDDLPWCSAFSRHPVKPRRGFRKKIPCESTYGGSDFFKEG